MENLSEIEGLLNLIAITDGGVRVRVFAIANLGCEAFFFRAAAVLSAIIELGVEVAVEYY